MRGIAELVEVTKSSPPTPSSVLPAVPPSQQFNGVGGASSLPDDLPPEEDVSKTPEPPAETPPTPVQAPPTPINNSSTEVMKSSNFAKMKSLLAMNMGISTEGQEVIQDESPSPTPSPVARRKAAKAPPPPKRGAQTTLGANRNSLSSSSSSISSNQSERVQGSHDARGSVEVPMATQQQLANQIPLAAVATHSPSRRKCEGGEGEEGGEGRKGKGEVREERGEGGRGR